MPDIHIVFFASLKERIKLDSYDFSFDTTLTIKGLKNKLAQELMHGELLLEPGVQSSIDYTFSRDSDFIPENAKEVAFFPPVTGG